MTQQTTTTSPDGQWMWDGTEWVPNTASPLTAEATVPPVTEKPKKKRLGLKITGGVVGVLAIVAMASAVSGGDATDASAQDAGSAAVAEAPAAEEAAPIEAEAPTETVAQSNAVRAAEDYLSFTAFSRAGLIDQLEFEGYSTADATYAVDSLDVDWNEQAAKSAQDYLELTAFSRQGLIEQLEFEGFTYEQAVYGVNTTGL